MVWGIVKEELRALRYIIDLFSEAKIPYLSINYLFIAKVKCIWKKTGEKHLKICNSYCVEPIWFGWLAWSAWQIELVDDLFEVQKRRSGISLGTNSKWCAYGRTLSEHKHTNTIHFKCERRNVVKALK